MPSKSCPLYYFQLVPYEQHPVLFNLVSLSYEGNGFCMQGLSMLLAMILKALGPHTERYYESDDDYLPDRVPLLKNYVPPQSYVISDPAYGVKNDAWNIRINSKVCA